MYGFKLSGGDIAVRGDGNVSTVTGHERIKQELACWLLEPIGTDPLYPRFGSSLNELIGSPMIEEYTSRVRREVQRVVANYIEYQKNQMNDDMLKGETVYLSNWQDSDIISSVQSIRLNAVADDLHVRVELNTVGGETVVVEQQVR